MLIVLVTRVINNQVCSHSAKIIILFDITNNLRRIPHNMYRNNVLFLFKNKYHNLCSVVTSFTFECSCTI